MSIKIFKLGDVGLQIPRLLLRGKIDFKFELLDYHAQNISKRKSLNFFLAGLNQYILPGRPLGYPVIAQVEPANTCNLSCPLCLSSFIPNSKKPAILPFEMFKQFIDDCGDYLLHLILWIWGEPFLNPDLLKMIAYAKARGIIVHTSTNGNVPFDEAEAEGIVESGLDSLVFGVDGATQETYERYRKGGRLNVVISNMQKVIRIKSLKGATSPLINMRFVVMRHNESEIMQARKLAEELGVDYFLLKTVDMPPETGTDLDATYAPGKAGYRRYEYDKNSFSRKQAPFVCMRPWKRITLNALGEVIPCEYDYLSSYSFGSIKGEGAPRAWKSDKSEDFRKAFHLGENEFYFCRDCTYKNSVVDDCVVERQAVGKLKG